MMDFQGCHAITTPASGALENLSASCILSRPRRRISVLTCLAWKLKIGRFVLVAKGVTTHDDWLVHPGTRRGNVLADDRLRKNSRRQNIAESSRWHATSL